MLSPILASLCLFATSSPPADTIRQSLSTHSDRMFFWLVVSSAVTGLGVILEAPGEFHELSRWWKLRRTGKKIGFRVPITFIGLVVVTAGIVGEGVFEFLSADAETAIRSHDEKVLGETIIKAGNAKDSADAAATAAGTAKLASEGAVSKADNAVSLAKRASISAESAIAKAGEVNREIAKAEAETMRVEQKYADRNLSKAKRDMFVSLLAKAKHKQPNGVSVLYAISATDGHSYAQELVDAMNDPATGWRASVNLGPSISTEDRTGVFVVVHKGVPEPPWAAELLQAMQLSGIEASPLIDVGFTQRDPYIWIFKKN